MTIPLPRAAAAFAAALLALGSAPRAQAQDADPAVVRGDARRIDNPYTTTWFGRPTELRLGYDLTLERRRNFNLDRTRNRDRRVRDQELKAEARMQIAPAVTALVELVAVSELRKRPASGEIDRREGLRRGQMWLQFDPSRRLPLTIQLGRVPLVDKRAWWWDDDLDAIRAIVRSGAWTLDTGLARELARRDSADPGIAARHDGVRRWFGQGRWDWRTRHQLEWFWLRAVDGSATPAPGSVAAAGRDDPSDARLSWVGLRASGQWRADGGPRIAYWADLARVAGHEVLTDWAEQADGRSIAGASTARRVRGQAWDLGLQWTPAAAGWPVRPTLTAALASGSGSADGAGHDGFFRQTGLHENKARLGGVKRIKRYGELFDPELANLRVATLGLGLRLLDKTSVELVLHRYRQAVASQRLPGAGVAARPDGVRRDLGHEVDLLLAVREWRHAELTLALSRFSPGAAFATRDAAHGIELGLALDF